MKRLFTLLAISVAVVFSSAQAQERQISGKVTSKEDNQTMPGVSVSVKGTTVGTITDMDGNYKLSVPSTAKTLVFSFIGMKTKEVEIGATDVIDIVMESDIMKLDEVVVTAIGISREKRSLGYATQQVKNDELTAGGNTNVVGALQGKVSGVNVTSLSGAPGAAQRIVIRGGTSLARNNQPLFIIDGTPVDNSNFLTMNPSNPTGSPDYLNNQVDYGSRANDVNPNDIESISVLKGPAATALYGSRASNGAIIITTKKGKRGIGGKAKTDVTLNSNVTFSSVLKLPETQDQFGQGDLDNIIDDRRENFSWGLPFDGQLRPWGQEINGRQRVKPYEALPDNIRDFYDVGVAYNNNLSFSGGTEKTTYYLSLASLNSKGIVPTSEYDKYSVRFNGSSELSNHFSTSISLNFSTISGVHPSGGQRDASIFDNLIQTPVDIPITEGEDQNDIYNAYNDATGTYGFYGAYTTNPYFILNNFKNTSNIDRLLGNFSVTYSKWSWLSITDRFGGDFYADRRYQKWKKYHYAPADESGLYGTPANDQLYNGKYSEDIYNFGLYNNDLMFTFKRDLTKDISGSLLLGQNFRQVTLTNNYGQTNLENGLALPGYYNLENSNGPAFVLNNRNQVRNIGYYAEINFSYKSMVFIGITGRNDYSSTLAEESNSYFYPGFNASFVFSELFKAKLKDKTWTYGKFRASWAKVGNDASAYLTTNFYSRTLIDGGFGSTVFPFGSVIGYTVGDRVANPDIKPEFTTAFELGTELGFLNDRLSLDFSYYENSSTDQIINLPIANSSGFTSKTINTGEIQNKGIEIGFRATPVASKDFKWQVYGSYTRNTNEVVSLYAGTDQLTLGGSSMTGVVAQVGKPYGAFYAADLVHTIQDDQSSPVVVDSITGMPMVTADLVYCGNYQPDYLASFGTTLTYKGFSLNLLFDTRQGGKFFSRTKDLQAFVGTSKETTDREDHVWPNSVYMGSDGAYHTNTTQTFHPYDYFTNVIPQGRSIIDASYVKFREASLTYSFPEKWISKTPFGSASLTIFGNNLVIWTPDENLYSDPEQNSAGASNTQGFEFGSNPSQRNWGIDLKVTF